MGLIHQQMAVFPKAHKVMLLWYDAMSSHSKIQRRKKILHLKVIYAKQEFFSEVNKSNEVLVKAKIISSWNMLQKGK